MANSTKSNAKSEESKRPGLGRLALGGLLVGVAALVGRSVAKRRGNPAEHAAPDLALDKGHPGPDRRAPEAFRPDPTAPVPKGERESLRPATGPKPTLVAGT